ncbi:hypothetical protein CHS0354_025428 [Potamilus streckersoni]|uniref:Uncharacterized protein n=1 Tax=Potamilus streckersoni TaxID=2493646 RepID=A0AAE0SPI4_9BIVA|nr:hypothetical protein CHS0354_025428 [Potamilus streckersoni]
MLSSARVCFGIEACSCSIFWLPQVLMVDAFLALEYWLVGASLFASNIGSGHFVGLAGSGAASGIGIAVFELSVFTMPEYLKKRFGGQRIRIYLVVLALLLYVFSKLSADLYSGALFITQSVDINLYIAVIILLAVSALFTITGGLTAVIWTDFIQVVIMILGAFILMVMSFIRVGGYEALVRKFFEAYPDTTIDNWDNDSYPYTKCGLTPTNSMNLIRSYDDKDLPWPGLIFGLAVNSVWYWCSDQVIVQRALSAKNLSHAKAGTILAGYLKLLPLWLIVFPGMAARVLFPNEVACGDPKKCLSVCGSEKGCTNVAYPKLVLEIMPVGLRGVMLAVMMSALISSLTSIFNSSSTMLTMDIWTRIRKHASDIELMIVGRLCIVILVAISVVWIPIVQNFGELFHYIQAISSFLAPPICAVYVLAIFWKRINEMGAFWGLMVGLLVGLVRFIWEYLYNVPPCGESYDYRPSVIKDIHYLHFAIILFTIVVIVTTIISLLTPPIEDKHLYRLTFLSRYSTMPREDIDVEVENEDFPKDKPQQLNFGNYSDLPWYKKSCMWICGIEKMVEQPKLTIENMRIMEMKQCFIYEEKWPRRILSINAILLMNIVIFLFGFFA